MINNPNFARDDRSFLQRQLDGYLQKTDPYRKKGLDPTELFAIKAVDMVNRPVEEGMLVLAYITTPPLGEIGDQAIVDIEVYAGDRRIRKINFTYSLRDGLIGNGYNLDALPTGKTHSNEIWGVIREYEPQKTDEIEFDTWDSSFPGIEWYSAPYEMLGHIGNYLNENLPSKEEKGLE